MKISDSVKSDRQRLLEDHLHMVKIIAYQVAVNLPPHVDVNDLIGAGMVGLLESVDRFDAARGVQFNTYASMRVRGAILDELRSMDWMTRSMRDKSNNLERAYGEIERRTGRPAEIEDVAKTLHITTGELHSMLSEVAALSVVNLEDLGVGSRNDAMDILECIKDPNAVDPLVAAKLAELKRVVVEAVEALPEKEKVIISLYYYEELTLKEIGRVLEITESRVCQLHSQMMHRLKASLKRFMND